MFYEGLEGGWDTGGSSAEGVRSVEQSEGEDSQEGFTMLVKPVPSDDGD